MKKFNHDAMFGASIVLFGLTMMGPLAVMAAGPAAVNLGSAGNFAILGKTGISTTGVTSVIGNIGVSPVAASYITGFGLSMDVSNTFSTSALVTGKVYASDYTSPTPTTMTTAISDMQTAYVDAAGRTNPTETELGAAMGAGRIGGTTLVPGLYKWSTDVTIANDMTLSGGPNDVWIFQVAGNLIMSSATHVILSGGAQASNVFWVVAGQTTIGTTAVFNGNILDQTTIVLNTGATLNGRALAQAAVTLDSNTVTVPTVAASVSVPVSTPAVTLVASTTPAPSLPNAGTAPAASASSANAALQAQLNGLLATLSSLQTQAAQQSSPAGASVLAHNLGALTGNLGLGSNEGNVGTLQQFLVAENKGLAATALANVGATGYFGALTHAALAEFQASVGISPASGNFGPITRAYLSAHY